MGVFGELFEPLEVSETWPCTWLIEVPSGHPEPDSPADTVRIIECGAPAREKGAGWECEAGHSYLGLETEWRLDFMEGR